MDDANGAGTGPLERLRAAAAERERAGLRRRVSPRGPDFDGLVDLASNDYLGLSRDPRLAEGAVRAVRAWGTGSTGSRLVTGSTELHAALENALTAFTGAAGALVFSSGYLANLAAVTALTGPETLVVSDAANHASIVDGCRLSRARVSVAPHRDPGAVGRLLAERGEEAAVVVTDAVFSVSGQLAPIRELHDVVRRHGGLLIVDEAHALGVVGPRGQGAVHAAGLAGEPDVVLTATLSKSLGSQGGAVLGAPEVIRALTDTGRSFIFDTGLAPACAGAALAALELIATEPGLPALARDRASRISRIAAGLGLETTVPDAAVVPVVLGAPQDAVRAAEICASHGLRAGCFRPPSVPERRACLRLTARASLTEAHLTTLAKALRAVAEQIGRTLP